MYPLYQDASKVLELMEQRKGTANRLSLNASIRNKQACLAIAAETSRSDYRCVLMYMMRPKTTWCISSQYRRMPVCTCMPVLPRLPARLNRHT